MRGRRVFYVGSAAAAMLGSFATAAHAFLNGTVKTAPYVAAPAFGTPVLAVLAVLLAAGGAYVLQRTRGGAIAKVAIVAVLAGLGALAYADGSGTIFTVSGAGCGTTTVFTFDLTVANTLHSNCPDPIVIVDLEFDCTAPDPPNECTLGLVLTNGQSCALPECKVT